MDELVSRLAGAGGSYGGRRRRLTALLRIDEREVSVERRKFTCDSAAFRERTEQVGRSFLCGYHAALEEAEPASLAARLERLPEEFRGFAHEGAGMALALLDTLGPWRRRFSAYVAGPGAHQLYIVSVGAGWILGRLPLRPRHLLRRLDPVLGWLALDGYGFHEGFFRWPRTIEQQKVPGKVGGYARRAFDQGVGRSLWFVRGADPGRLAAAIGRFPHGRQADLWAGIGLASAFAGGCDETALRELVRLAGPFTPMLGQGATFAAEARVRGGNPAPHTELACRVICDRTSTQLAALCEETAFGLPADDAEPAFEVWRQRIQTALSGRGAR